MVKATKIVLFCVILSSCVHSVTKLGGSTGLTGLAALDNNPHLTVSSLAVTPSAGSAVIGDTSNTVGYTATATLSNGSTYNVTTIAQWASSDNNIASFQSLTAVETFQCNGPGTATITAIFGNLSATASITCTGQPPPPTLTSLQVQPSTATIPVGATQTFTVTGTFSDGSTQDLTGAVAWSGSNNTVASITSGNTFKCNTGGTITVTATLAPATPATATLTCNAVLVSIAIAPSTSSVLIGAQPTYIATGTYNDASTQNVTLTAAWTSSNNTVAKPVTPVTNPETVNALATGTATITATIGGVSGTATLTVTASGPPPPTLASITIGPSTVVLNVGQTADLTAVGTFTDGSTQNVTAASNWTTANSTIAQLQLTDALLGLNYSKTLSGTGTTPYTWTVPAAPAGTKIDMLDQATMPLPTRNTTHLSATGLYKGYVVNGGLLWWIKNLLGNPWDGLLYDDSFIYDWFTENGDASQQAACQAAGYTSCFMDPFAFKMFVTPVSAMPRYFTVGGPDVVLKHPSPNNFMRTTNCGADNQPLINLGNMIEVTHDGDYFGGGSTRAFGGSVGTQHTIERLHYWGLANMNYPPTSGHVEVFDLVAGFGQVEWRDMSWNGSAYVVNQDSLNNVTSAGGAPTPNFACKVPKLPITGGLPPGQLATSNPNLNLKDSTGAITGIPNLVGTYPFTVQQEDASGAFHLQSQTIRVDVDAAHALQTVKCLAAGGPILITATDGAISGTRNVTCQNPTPTLVSVAITPSAPNVAVGATIGMTATGTFSDGTTQNLTSSATWVSSNTSIVLVAASGSPRNATCNAAGTSSVTAQSGAVTSPGVTVTCTTPSTGNGGNINCTPAGTWVGSATDGPAALPSVCMNTALSNTPSPGTLHSGITTCSGLQSAINAGVAGDIYEVVAGTDLGLCTITLPVKSGSNSTHWNLIRTSGVSNGSFPAEGTRMTPCLSNKATMPNRTYPCTSPLNLTFKISAPLASNAYIVNGSFWRIEGNYITRNQAHGLVFFLINVVGTASNFIIDRSWIDGVEGTFPQTTSNSTETQRAIALGQSNHVALIDSYVTNIYCDSGITPCDANVIGGGTGSVANSGWGVYKVVNNHMEAAAEGILLGGGNGPARTPNGCTPTVNCNLDVPTDIEVRQNYFFKPPQWNGNTTTPGGTGWPIVKNGFEMKSGARALFEANVIENCWYNAQVCFAFSLAPKNQSGGSPLVGTCLTCLTNDFTYRYNYSYNVAYGIGLYQSMDSGCPTCQAQGANRVSVHDNLIGDNLNLGNLTTTSAGDEMELYAAQDTTHSGLNQLNNFSIVHNTFVKGIRALAIFGSDSSGQMHTWTVQNNIWSNANFGVLSMNTQPTGCDVINSALNNLFKIETQCVTSSPAVWDHNLVINWNQGTLGRNWPTNGSGLGNFFLVGSTGAGFVNYNNANSNFSPSNYQLLSNSPYHNAGSDGKDLGADIPTLVNKIQGVRQ